MIAIVVYANRFLFKCIELCLWVVELCIERNPYRDSEHFFSCVINKQNNTQSNINLQLQATAIYTSQTTNRTNCRCDWDFLLVVYMGNYNVCVGRSIIYERPYRRYLSVIDPSMLKYPNSEYIPTVKNLCNFMYLFLIFELFSSSTFY